jgi:hypothetical protein
MSDYVQFSATVETMAMGRSTYTLLRLPAAVAKPLLASGVKRVEGEINEHAVNLALTTSPHVEGLFVWAGKSLLDRIGIGPGETVDVRLRQVADELVELPDDLAQALSRALAMARWLALTPGKRRGHLYQLGTAKTVATRNKRITAIVDELVDAPAKRARLARR